MINQDKNAITITIGHPSAVLSSNGRAHWRTRARVAKSLKAKVRPLTRVAVPIYLKREELARYSIKWYFKGRRPDDDNIIGRCKYIKDAMCEVIGIDDQRLRIDTSEEMFVRDKARAGTVEFSIF